jgi:hypothetical protein
MEMLLKLKDLMAKVKPALDFVLAHKEWMWFAAGFLAAKLVSCLVS